MGTYFNEAFERDELKDVIQRTFWQAAETNRNWAAVFGSVTGDVKHLNEMKWDLIREFFDHMVEFHFPNLDEVKSLGPIQEYIDLKRKMEDERTVR